MDWILRILLALALLGASPLRAEDVVDRGFELLQEARNLPGGPFSPARHGKKFDDLVDEFYKKMVAEGLATPITETFAGDEIKNGYRIGNTEIWLRKKAPGVRIPAGRSVDIIVWRLETDKDGKVVRARAEGMDHHTVHPQSPTATNSQKNHWSSKVATAEAMEEDLRRKGFSARINMAPDNSFYWRDAATARTAEVDEFTAEKSRRAVGRLGSQMGGNAFAVTSFKALGGSLAVIGIGSQGAEALQALETFYRSPLLARTLALLNQGKYDDARRYWEAQCVSERDRHDHCEQLAHKLAPLASLLSARVYTDFPEGMRHLFDRWERAARQANLQNCSGTFFRVDKRRYETSDTVLVEYCGMPGNADDWFTVVKAEAGDDTYDQWSWAPGTRGSKVFGPYPAGQYEARFYYRWKTDGYVVQHRAPFTVGQPASRSTYNYQGCYVDQSARVLSGHAMFADRDMTNAKCQQTCAALDFDYAGTEYSGECFCGNSLSAEKAPESECSYKCNGNQEETCGGYWRISIYKR